MALKELEYLGRTSSGELPDRINALADNILNKLEAHYDIEISKPSTPERVKELRGLALKKLSELQTDEPNRKSYENDLDDLFLVIQLFSYPGDYVEERPTVERMAETLDKFEEDVLGVFSASIRGPRRAIVSFGTPIEVASERKNKSAAPDLTCALESAVQQELDGIQLVENRFASP